MSGTAAEEPGGQRPGPEWRRFSFGPWPADETVPQEQPDEATRRGLELPPTLRPVAGGEAVVQRPVFDPSVQHHTRAMRLGEPEFADAQAGTRWYAARRRALDHVLAAVADSPWAPHLVLRGSVLLRAWYGDAAREPGDLDFVVEPVTWQLADPRTERMLEELARAAEEHSARAGGPVLLDARGAARDEIWTYDRVPGRRLVVPWNAEGLPGGTVQLDFVFGEALPAPAAPTRVPRPDGVPGGPLTLRAATRELSLAWKVLWLANDMYPEGKDFYDAVLLAEDPSFTLSFDLLRAVFRDVEYGYFDRNPVLAGVIRHAAAQAEWREFAKDHPHITGPAATAPDGPPAEWLERLDAGLAPTFAPEDDGSGESVRYRLSARWLAPLVAESHAAFAAGGLPAVLQRLHRSHVPPGSALVVARQLLGPAGHTLEEVCSALAAFRPDPDPERAWRREGWPAPDLARAAEWLRGD